MGGCVVTKIWNEKGLEISKYLEPSSRSPVQSRTTVFNKHLIWWPFFSREPRHEVSGPGPSYIPTLKVCSWTFWEAQTGTSATNQFQAWSVLIYVHQLLSVLWKRREGIGSLAARNLDRALMNPYLIPWWREANCELPFGISFTNKVRTTFVNFVEAEPWRFQARKRLI